MEKLDFRFLFEKWVLGKHKRSPKFAEFSSKRLFESVRNSERNILIENGLMPSSRILDVGCGYGTLARGLENFLENGSYEGFDITEQRVDYCRRIFRKNPRFNFTLVNCSNREYNPEGGISACQVKFPYEDESFDYVALFSVFTHLSEEEVDHYATEISRVLKIGGKCIASFFISEGKAPDGGTSFPSDRLAMFEKNRFRYDWISKGYWRDGRQPKNIYFQDIVMFTKGS